jgi:hypothetical protein
LIKIARQQKNFAINLLEEIIEDCHLKAISDSRFEEFAKIAQEIKEQVEEE